MSSEDQKAPATTVSITMPAYAPAEIRERVQNMARDLSENARIHVELEEIRTCRVCGCTDDEGCMFGCTWVTDAEDLCSSCAPGDVAPIDLLTEEKLQPLTPSDHSIVVDVELRGERGKASDQVTIGAGTELIRRLVNYGHHTPPSTAAEEDFFLQLQESLENTSSFYIPVDELRDALGSLQSVDDDVTTDEAYQMLLEQLERTSSFHVTLDELRDALNSLQRHGWAILTTSDTTRAGEH